MRSTTGTRKWSSGASWNGMTAFCCAGAPLSRDTACGRFRRETLEEANARVEIGPLYAVYNIPHIGQVYLLFRARLLNADVRPGAETLEVALYSESEIPWDRLAFATVRNTLQHYFSDRRKGVFQLHIGLTRR